MYEVLIWGNGPISSVGISGTFIECLSWMVSNSFHPEIKFWELKTAPPKPRVTDMSKVTIFGKVEKFRE